MTTFFETLGTDYTVTGVRITEGKSEPRDCENLKIRLLLKISLNNIIFSTFPVFEIGECHLHDCILSLRFPSMGMLK
jgi:hypothetical protein